MFFKAAQMFTQFILGSDWYEKSTLKLTHGLIKSLNLSFYFRITPMKKTDSYQKFYNHAV